MHNVSASTESVQSGDAGKEETGKIPLPARRSARKSGRNGFLSSLAAAILLVGGAGAVVAAGSVLPQAPSSRSVPAAVSAVPAGTSVGVCPGPARVLEGTVAGTDPQFSPESATAASAVTAAVLSAGGQLPASRLAGLDGSPGTEVAAGSGEPAAEGGAARLLAGVIAGQQVSGVNVLSADAVAGQTASVAGVMKFTATDGDLQGLAAANCQQPSNDQWLAGASTTIGRTSVLVLTNVSATPATVSLELYGAAGQIQAPGSRGLLVAPGTSRPVVLAGLAPGEARLSVRVKSAGGPVAAVIQQSVLRGLTPGGVDFIAPGAAPAVRQVMTGIDIQDPTQSAAPLGDAGYEDAVPALQLTVPGPADAVVEVRIYGRDGQKNLPDGGVLTAKAGAVTEIPLGGIPAGHYTVVASSDVSFVAATRITRGLTDNAATDVAWATSGTRLGSQHVVPVPQGGQRHLLFGAVEGRASITYAAITADGAVGPASTADIAGGTTTSIAIPDKAGESAIVGYVVAASGDAAYGGLLLQQDGRNDVSTVGFLPAAAGQEVVPVTLVY